MLEQNNNLKNSNIVKHFVQEDFRRRRIYYIIKHYEIGLFTKDLPRSGHPTSFNGKDLKRLKNATVNHVCVSQRKLAKKFDVVQSTMQYNLKKTGLKYYKRQKAPKFTLTQLKQVTKNYRKMRHQITTSSTFIIVEDEKYFTLLNDDMLQNAAFYSFDKEHASDNVIYKTKGKYPKKTLGWLALSAKGISTPYVSNTKGSVIISDRYINKCSSKLFSFIEEHHTCDEYIFWPDSASSHYANETIQ